MIISCKDEFTDKVIHVMVEANKAGIVQPISLAVHRSDYMIDSFTDKMIQVEINTISSSFGSLGPAINRLHDYLIKRYEPHGYSAQNLVLSESNIKIPRAIAKAHECYNNPNAVVLFIVQRGERNTTDQRIIE